ncbi:MAG TPA: enoyl-CoA hydratase/isomerase family protein [Proteobacteria bacterium]|nr:enoyl-CoA hydratase/isomerase family protein [Deltaproteobacteria bacterium]HDS17253.1 enoyl-CoA hydratase/isomerase family protein [Pseudomonadota bacterium]
MSYEFMNLKTNNGVGIISLNRPPANSLNVAIVAELERAFDEMAAAEAVKVVVIVSEIPGFFVAGADIKMFNNMNAYEAWEISGDLQRVNQKLEDMPKLTIAAIGGYALGGGLELALACDFRFMAESVIIKDKEKIPTVGLPETTLGILPGAGGTQRLARLIGAKRALYYIATAKNIGPKEALELGIVQELMPGNELNEKTIAFAESMATKAVIGIAQAKKAIYQGYNQENAVAMQIEQDAFMKAFASEDASEGLKAFVEKRAAVFQGK